MSSRHSVLNGAEFQDTVRSRGRDVLGTRHGKVEKMADILRRHDFTSTLSGTSL